MDTLDHGSVKPLPPPIPPHTASWEQLWAAIDTVPGWLTEDQALVLRGAVLELPSGSTVVEIGSHQGRSTLALATARADVRIIAIDPFIKTRLLPGRGVEQVLRANLSRFGVEDVVTVIATTSRQARRHWDQPVDLLWIDGKHDIASLLSDLRWAEWLRPRAQILVHDAFSSIGVTTGLIADQIRGGALRYEGRTGSLACFRHLNADRASRAAFTRNVPWWIRNVTIKVLLRLRLRSAARRIFGHTQRADPY